MVNDVSQWLAEIQSLRQQLQVLGQERDQAYASAANWRRLYESEAEQRRNETETNQLRIRALANELDMFKASPVVGDGKAHLDLQQVLAQVDQIESLAELRSRLSETLTLCNHLSNALQTEQIAHEETRQKLTTALGDTIDLITKEPAPEPNDGEA